MFQTGLILAALIVAAVSHSMEQVMQPEQENSHNMEEENGKLNMITITQEVIEGEYHSLAGGIHFRSEVQTEYHFLSITTADGERLVIAKQPHDSNMLMTVSGTDFLVMKNPSNSGLSKYTDYIVPNIYHKRVEKALKRDRLSSKLLQQLVSTEVNESRHDAVANLAMRSEIELITGAAVALGNTGVTGSQVPAAMPFYVLTLRLTKYRERLLNGIDFEIGYDDSRDLLYEGRQKRSCHQCTDGYCPYRGYGSNCFGMCGSGCSCWSWVCGDCCVHQGCYDHDGCCQTYGFWSWSCLVPWGFSCSGGYDC